MSVGIIKIPVLFDMSGDAVVFGEEVSGDFVTSHLDFLLDMTTEANDISLNATDISSAILIGDQDTGDNIFYSGGSSGNVAVDNLCNRIAKAITRGKLLHIPKAGDHSNSGIPMGGRANLTNNLGELGSQYATKYLTSVSPIGDEQMLGQAMARVASIHLVGSPLAAGIFEDQNQIQTDLETASTQTFNGGNTAFYNALAVQLSKVLGGSKSSAPMNNGSGSGSGGGGSGGTPLPPDWTQDTSVGATKEWYSVASSADGTKLAATAKNGNMWTSTDSGATWTENTTSPGATKEWYGVASSADGTKLVATAHNGNIYTSTDSGATWTSRESSRKWRDVTSSTDGTKLATVVADGNIYTSTDSGVTWTQRASYQNWYGIAGSADGTKLAATENAGKIWYSTDSGATWTESASFSTTYYWKGIASSADGTKMVAGVDGGKIWNSTDGGATWTENTTSPGASWKSFTSSADGTKMAAAVKGGNLWTSTDSGATWTEDTSVGATKDWWEITCSDDFTNFAAVVRSGYIWTKISSGGSVDSGSGGYPLDASGVAVPALKSIYEQLMNVPGRSQIMETRDISGVVDNSNVTLAGGFPFISGDKLVMYLRPKIIFAAQTKAEQNTSLITASGPISTTIDVPVYDIGRKSSAGGAISGQIYTNSSSYSDNVNDNWGFHKCFEGDHTDDEDWTTAAGGGHTYSTTSPFDYTGNQKTTNIDGSNELLGEWGQVDIGQNTVINKFQIWPRPSYRDSRSPSDFSLLGSLDGTNWTTIKAVSGLPATAWYPGNGNTPDGTNTWELDSVHGPYRYYRLSVSSRVGVGDGFLSLTGLLLYGAKSPSEVTTGSTGAVSDISGIQTNIVATAQNIEDAFPGNANAGNKPEINKWGWMGSTNSDSLTLETTDVTDTRTCDLHIWKITITL